MAEQQGNNVINNYKGVMLCSRPNENQNAQIQKPFCGRVFNHEKIGLVPCKNERSPVKQQKKTVPSILSKHKKWLHDFQQKQAQVKQQIENKTKQDQQRFQKIKNLAQVDRERSRKMKNEYNQTATNVLNILDDAPNRPAPMTGQLTSANLRKLDEANQNEQTEKSVKQKVFRKKNKKQKPMWAMTEDQIEKKQQQQADELLSFFENADIADYSQDQQVKNILHSLRDKIQQLKETQDWKDKQAKKLFEKKQARLQNKDIEDDKYSNFSVNSEARSIASQKTQKNIDELRKKKYQQPEWDQYTTSQKKSHANIEDRIAKNLADEVLRNYPHLKGVHSNTSIRKLLQAQAAKVINQPIPRPVITTVIKDPKPLDTNNLPYLHRNPAI